MGMLMHLFPSISGFIPPCLLIKLSVHNYFVRIHACNVNSGLAVMLNTRFYSILHRNEQVS